MMNKTEYMILILLALFIISFGMFVLVVDIEAEEITLTWDMPEQQIDGVRIFQTVPVQDENGQWVNTYDYALPVSTPIYVDGNIPPEVNEVTIDLPGRTNQITKYCFVARAFLAGEESADSNEVDYKVNLIPPVAPIELSGSYEKDEQLINLSWQQPQDDWAISHWVVYSKLPEGEFTELGRVDHGQELTLTQPLVAPVGQRTNMSFAVVAFRSSGIYSSNSNELEIDIDRREVPPINNLQIKVQIPL